MIALLAACARVAAAQGRTHPAIADSSAVQIMAHVGANPGAVWFGDILRQNGAEYPPAKLNELADSLVRRAIDPRGAEPRSAAHARAVNALNALIAAGGGASRNGRPYVGAFDRLVTVHQKARAPDLRARALGGMLAVASSHLRAVDYLRRIAESTSGTAYDAVEFLITDANGGSWVGAKPSASESRQSIDALKALAASGHVADPRAARLLDSWIQKHRSEHS